MKTTKFINSPIPYITQESISLAMDKVHNEGLAEYEIMPERDFAIASKDKDGEKYIFFFNREDIPQEVIKEKTNWRKFFTFGIGSVRLIIGTDRYLGDPGFILEFQRAECASLVSLNNLSLLKDFSEEIEKTVDVLHHAQDVWSNQLYSINITLYDLKDENAVLHDYSSEE